MRSGLSNGKGKVSRRKFLASSTALATAVGALSGVGTAQQGQESGRKVSDKSKSDPGPTNTSLDVQNPSSVMPPVTDAEMLHATEQTLKLMQERGV